MKSLITFLILICSMGCESRPLTDGQSILVGKWYCRSSAPGGWYQTFYRDGTVTFDGEMGHEDWKIDGGTLTVTCLKTGPEGIGNPEGKLRASIKWLDENHFELSGNMMASHCVRVCEETRHRNQYY